MSTVPLSIPALSLDILIALAQRPEGIGAGPLGRVIDGPPTSVQNNLRVLTAHGLVHRAATRYLLTAEVSGVAELVAAGLRLAPPSAALRLIFRANDTVEFGSEDNGGFVLGLRAEPDPLALAALETSIATVRRDRPVPVPPILRFETEELGRILHSALGLRARIAAAAVIKGTVRIPVRSAASGYTNGPGGRRQIRG